MANPPAVRRRVPACAVVATAIDTGLKHGQEPVASILVRRSSAVQHQTR